MGTISISLPSDGTTGQVSQYNGPLTTITNEVNGNLDNANIKSGAAIATSKLASDNGITAAMISSSAITLGYAEITSTFTAGSGSETDITGLTVTVDVPTGTRRIEVLVYIPQMFSSVDGTRHDLKIQEDGVEIGGFFSRTWSGANGGNGGVTVFANKAATAGSHTYKARVGTGLLAGLASIFAAATTPAYITVRAY